MNNIRKLRELKGLTQEELGKLIGAEKATVYRHEKGRIQLTEEKINAYAKALECAPSEIISAIPLRPFYNEINIDVLGFAIKEISQASFGINNLITDEQKYKLIANLYNEKIKETKAIKAPVVTLHKEIDKR